MATQSEERWLLFLFLFLIVFFMAGVVVLLTCRFENVQGWDGTVVSAMLCRIR